jgi:hypothetical protein
MSETRVDLVHILEDLRDAYPASIEDTILTEIMANALDSGARMLEPATTIRLQRNPPAVQIPAHLAQRVTQMRDRHSHQQI